MKSSDAAPLRRSFDQAAESLRKTAVAKGE